MNAAPPDSPAIELLSVTKRFHRGGWRAGDRTIIALKAVSIAVAPGEIFGLVGESGSGKTTAGRLMVGLERPDQGTVRVGGRDLAHMRGKEMKRFRRQVQIIFQDPYQSLNPRLTVLSTVSEPLAITGRGDALQRRVKAVQTLALVGLDPPEEFLHRYPHQLSGGQRQRVAIARAMVLEPRVLVADEPASMLDASIAVQIYQLLADIQRRQGVTLVLITHNLAVAHFLCDRIAVIYRGHVMEGGPAAEVIAHPRHPYTQALLEALPRYGHLWPDKRYDTLRPEAHGEPDPAGCPFYSRCKLADERRCASQQPELRCVAEEVQAACFMHDQGG